MATISGKRFQITDGASTPTNLFPYTVTEAVYGLSTVLANTQSAAVTAAATSAASLYLPLSGGSSKPMTGAIYVPNSASALTVVGSNSSILFGVADSQSHFGQTAGTTYLRSGDTNLQHNKAGTNYAILDASNFRAGTEYVSISGAETITGAKTFTGAVLGIKYDNPRIVFYTSSGTLNGVIGVRSLGVPEFYHPTNGWSTIYHSGNSNKSDVDWTANNLIVNGNVGIGTASPANKLHVYNGTNAWAARIENNYSSSSKTTVYLAANEYGILAESAGSSSSYYLMALRYNGGNNTAFYVRQDGNVGIGTSSPSYKLDVASGNVGDAVILSSSTTYSCIIYRPNGATGTQWSVGCNTSSQFYFYSNAAIRAYFTQAGSLVTTGDQVISSDINLKTNLQDVTYGVEDIAKTRAVTFDWKDGRGKSAGSIAQDWKPLIPELVHGEEGNMTLAYGQIALVNSILLAKHETEQDKEIKKLKNRVKELENEVKRLRS